MDQVHMQIDWYNLLEWWMTCVGFMMACSGIPQIIRMIQLKSSEDVSYLLWFIILHGQLWWTFYGWLYDKPSLFYTNIATGISTSGILITIWFYRRSGRRTKND